MKAILYGTEQDQELLLSLQGENKYFSVIDRYDIYEDYIKALEKPGYEVVIVMLNNAKGYKGVYAARTVRKATPIIWLSDDAAFVQLSYDFDCSWFSTKEKMTSDYLTKAVERCREDAEGKLHTIATTEYRTYELDGDKLKVLFVLDEESGVFLGNYPDFDFEPRYTPNGRPWTTSADDDCEYASDKKYGDCGSYDYFVKQNEKDVVGICTHPDKRIRS